MPVIRTSPSNQTHPATFKPEFNDAVELGTKNTLLDGALTLNSRHLSTTNTRIIRYRRIIDRTAVNMKLERDRERGRARNFVVAHPRPEARLHWRI